VKFYSGKNPKYQPRKKLLFISLKLLRKMRTYSRRDSSMSPSEMGLKSAGSASDLRVVERGEGWFKVQHGQKGNICTIIDTFAEMFLSLATSPANSFF